MARFSTSRRSRRLVMVLTWKFSSPYRSIRKTFDADTLAFMAMMLGPCSLQVLEEKTELEQL